jgi:hypothetical protein
VFHGLTDVGIAMKVNAAIAFRPEVISSISAIEESAVYVSRYAIPLEQGPLCQIIGRGCVTKPRNPKRLYRRSGTAPGSFKRIMRGRLCTRTKYIFRFKTNSQSKRPAAASYSPLPAEAPNRENKLSVIPCVRFMGNLPR